MKITFVCQTCSLSRGADLFIQHRKGLSPRWVKGYSKFDQILDWLRDRYGWTWFDQDPEAWKKVNPKLAAKIQELEDRINKL